MALLLAGNSGFPIRGSGTGEEIREEEMRKQKDNADKSSKQLSTLDIGTPVLVQDPITKRWDKSAIITRRRNARSYTIRTPNGKFYLRNRKFLRPKKEDLPSGSPLPSSTIPSSPILKKDPKTSTTVPLRRSQRRRQPTIRFKN